LTKDCPKPLLPIAGRPIIEYTLELMSRVEGLDRIYVVVNHYFADKYIQWCAGFRSPLPVEIVDDGTISNEDRLGATADMQFVIEQTGLKDDLLVVAGDNLLRFSLNDFVSFCRPRGVGLGLKNLQDTSLVPQYSVVKLDQNYKVIDFEEKPAHPKSTLISIGLYYFPRRYIGLIKDYLDAGNNPDAPGYFMQWLYKVVDVYGYVIEGPWFDIGDIASYNRANELFE
jgi:glucose-1-phosphate thymidylyltransferase